MRALFDSAVCHCSHRWRTWSEAAASVCASRWAKLLQTTAPTPPTDRSRICSAESRADCDHCSLAASMLAFQISDWRATSFSFAWITSRAMR